LRKREKGNATSSESELGLKVHPRRKAARPNLPPNKGEVKEKKKKKGEKVKSFLFTSKKISYLRVEGEGKKKKERERGIWWAISIYQKITLQFFILPCQGRGGKGRKKKGGKKISDYFLFQLEKKKGGGDVTSTLSVKFSYSPLNKKTKRREKKKKKRKGCWQ